MKKINYILIFVLIIGMCIPIISYAFDNNNVANVENKCFFEIEKTEAYIGETISMNINIDKIKYENYKFSLNSNFSLENVMIQDEIESEVETNQLVIEGNKLESNISKITLYYTIPENIEVGETIELTAKIEEMKNEEDNENFEENSENQSDQITLYITIVNKSNEDTEINKDNNEFNKVESNENFEISKEENNSNEFEIKNVENTNQNSSKTSLVQTSGTISNQQNSNTQTYNGESNNYLSDLSVEGYEFNTEFTKTNTNYFIEVPNNITNIEVNAEAEDENAKVTIYGNDNLEEGTNKILISVTAENGDVKTYRIYVKKDA